MLRMDYPAIVTALAERGVPATEAALQRAEWLARVRLDAELFAPARPGDPGQGKLTVDDR